MPGSRAGSQSPRLEGGSWSEKVLVQQALTENEICGPVPLRQPSEFSEL